MSHISGEIFKGQAAAQGLNAFCWGHTPKQNQNCPPMKPYQDLDFTSLAIRGLGQSMADKMWGRETRMKCHTFKQS